MRHDSTADRRSGGHAAATFETLIANYDLPSGGTMKTDSQLQRDVIDELRFEPRVGRCEIGVVAMNGIVTLTGRVDNCAKKYAAVRAATRVAGVTVVADEVSVSVPTAFKRTDTDVAYAVASTLHWHVQLPDDTIKARVEDGWVWLNGKADWQYQVAAAERAVRNLVGVRGVTNLLAVKAKPIVDAAQLRSSIETALKRQIEREAQHIDIKTKDGVVTLSGTVHSWAEKKAIENVARFAPGVRKLDNKLIVNAFA
jgi:osmotically-inducible protein OsmY